MVNFFENSSKNVKTIKNAKSPPKLSIPVQIQQRIIMPAGGIPKYYGIPQKQRTKSPNLIKNVEVMKPPEKIDKEKIKNNMQNMKVLLEKKGIPKRPFRIEPSNYHRQNNQNNNHVNLQQNPQFSHDKFLAAKNIFEPKNKNAINQVYENKPIRKDVKKKAKLSFHE